MSTPARLLRLLAMFTTRPSWRADELAERLEVTQRTLRRDITRLRELGYPIHSTTGRYGGYELGAGGRLPPLLLDDDEAIAVSVALRDMSRTADPTLGEAALAAATKLRQVLPDTLRDRVDALGEMTVGVDQRTRNPPRGADPIALSSLMVFAMSCRRGERVTFTYRDGSDKVSERRVEPHRLVSLSRRWYLVGFDLDRDAWRTYRVDRTSQLAATGHRNTQRETPDAAEQVTEGVALSVFEIQARVLIHAPKTRASDWIGPTVGVFEPDGDDTSTCTVRIGGDAEWIARFVAGLPVHVDVLEPEEVRVELRKLARAFLRHHAAPPNAM